MAMGKSGSTVGVGGAEELAQEERHQMDHEKSNDDYKHEEVVDERNL